LLNQKIAKELLLSQLTKVLQLEKESGSNNDLEPGHYLT